jgi:general stress protein 26
MSSPEHKQKIWKMIKDIKIGMLVTLDQDVPRARPMHLVQDEYDGTMVFHSPQRRESAGNPE